MGFFSKIKNIFTSGKPESNAHPSLSENKETAREMPIANEIKEESGEPSIEASTMGRPVNPPESGAEAQIIKTQQEKEEQDKRNIGKDYDSDEQILIELRKAEPKLSQWLKIVLNGVTEADGLLWERLNLLFTALNASPEEIDIFIEDFKKWVNLMEYTQLEEFGSELQYRIALALDLEDEEDERNRLFIKLNDSLAKTREKIEKSLNAMFKAHNRLNEAFWDDLTDILISADFGVPAATYIVERLQEKAKGLKIENTSDLRPLLEQEIREIFSQPRRITAINKPEVILMVGVNGVGKTTTIAKLAYREKLNGKRTLIVGADTFRAAAIEQLEIWAKRVDADFYAKKPGSDPASVVWEAMDKALKENYDTVFVDTAGRLQTKTNLMEELTKIKQILSKKHPGAPHRSILVLDATTGQNALSQAKLFNKAAGIDELILTKLDGTAKGGVAIAVALQEKLPITFVGLGEKMEDLRPFDGKNYANILIGDK